ncbi:hypothetical protein QBC40DRAFT_322311 [Triangularia verruculosa]|uniref:Uncharacterized protein n=1 Tax=Triangularia verruculosa TaxID=2587418 RepID=A0AAN7AX25_9PEZI|nr:hypothetical protein QBC40DRAFT_322311 [Triangularia verruculosa]
MQRPRCPAALLDAGIGAVLGSFRRPISPFNNTRLSASAKSSQTVAFTFGGRMQSRLSPHSGLTGAPVRAFCFGVDAVDLLCKRRPRGGVRGMEGKSSECRTGPGGDGWRSQPHPGNSLVPPHTSHSPLAPLDEMSKIDGLDVVTGGFITVSIVKPTSPRATSMSYIIATQACGMASALFVWPLPLASPRAGSFNVAVIVSGDVNGSSLQKGRGRNEGPLMLPMSVPTIR